MSLSATVQRLRNRENDQRDIKQDRGAFVSKWKKDVEDVYVQFEKALKEFVDSGDANISRGRTTISEELLGDYEIETLIIEVIGKRILLIPIARMTIGGTGRLDLYREDRPSEDNRILLIRGSASSDHHPDIWLIQEPRKQTTVLESALMNIPTLIERGKRIYQHLDDRTIQDGIDYVLNV